MPLAIRITHRFALLAALAVALVGGSVALALVHVRATMLEQKRLEIRHSVEAGATILRGFLDRAKAGEMTEAEARRVGAEAIRAARFDNGNYFYVYDFDGNTVMHPIRKDLEGKNVRSLKDKFGTAIVEDIVAIARGPGQGYSQFFWIKPGDKEETLKVAYTVAIPEWLVLVGSGLHVHDVDAMLWAKARELAWQVGPAALFFIGLALLIGRSVARPLGGLTASMQRLASGDVAAPVAGVGRRDEIGQIAAAVDAFRDSLKRQAADEQARETTSLVEAERARKAMLAEVVAAFETRVKSVADRVLASADAMRSTADAMTRDATAAQSEADRTAAASREVRTTVAQVAGNADDLAQAVGEIAREVTQASSITRDAVGKVQETQGVIASLAGASAEIGNVLRLIQAIAEQTNLLALNATIEAARAGEAGKGFAVVASEVKHLAGQTSRATEDIASRIAAIQSATRDAVQAVETIGATIVRMNEISTSISAAVEEQSASTNEIGLGVGEASASMDAVADAMRALSDVASTTRGSAVTVSTSAGELAQEARHLGTEISGFMARLQAA